MTRALVTGGAGFIGSHLCDRLIAEGWDVLCVDNLLTGRKENIEHLLGHERFAFLEQDVCEPFEVEGVLDWVLHLASPASPVDYMRHPLETLRVNAEGTRRMLDLAVEKGARFLLASTSEVYGDPQVHPQPETYWGNVNPIGPRSCYDEGKRYAEALTMAYHRVHGLDIRIARIFNTYGPRMRLDDGRVVPTFIRQAMAGEPLTIHGDGTQTRSLCYVDDLIEGLWRLIGSDYQEPVNLGSDEELTVREIGELICRILEREPRFEPLPPAPDDPAHRRPDLSAAQHLLGWAPGTSAMDGLRWAFDHLHQARRPGSGPQGILDSHGERQIAGRTAGAPDPAHFRRRS
ncbi:MAG TPA: UDP-glucuronic acid decarboxylase family protein [Actinomycetota bacterium]|nr:UDP-glucuronic acid decarboxylase family protein [Actinomycetota bacterium]